MDGKIGHNLSAFNDSLRGGFGRHECGQPIHSKWLAYEKSVRDPGKGTVEQITEIIQNTNGSGHSYTLEQL